MQTIWQNPQHHPQGSQSSSKKTPSKKIKPKKTMASPIATPPAVTPASPVPMASPPPRLAKVAKPTGSKRLQNSTPDPVNSGWSNPPPASSPWNMPPSFGSDPAGFGAPSAFGAPPSPWGQSPYGGFGGPASGMGASNEQPLSKLSEDQRQEVIKKCFQIALGKEPEQKDFNYYKYSVLTESKLLLNLINGTQHKDLVEKGQKYSDLEKRTRELEMQLKFNDEHNRNTAEENKLLHQMINEKNSIIHVLRENINKFQKNPNRVEILQPVAQPASDVLPETAPPVEPAPAAVTEPSPASDPEVAPTLLTPVAAEPTDLPATTVEPDNKTLFANPIGELAKKIRELLSPPY